MSGFGYVDRREQMENMICYKYCGIPDTRVQYDGPFSQRKIRRSMALRNRETLDCTLDELFPVRGKTEYCPTTRARTSPSLYFTRESLNAVIPPLPPTRAFSGALEREARTYDETSPPSSVDTDEHLFRRALRREDLTSRLERAEVRARTFHDGACETRINFNTLVMQDTPLAKCREVKSAMGLGTRRYK